jgi:hypothetical protein
LKFERYEIKFDAKRPSFVRQYTPGELEIFEEMITRMISSKNSEIYSIVKKKVKEKKEKEELRKLELQQQDIIKSPSESKADETNDNNEDDDESELDEFKKLN